MDQAQALELLASIDAVKTDDHFVYTAGDHGGDHGEDYVDKSAVTVDPVIVQAFVDEFAVRLRDVVMKVVVSPAVGAIPLGFEFARQTHCRFVYTEKVDGRLTLGRGYDRIVHNKNVVVIEDILNSGKSSRETIEAVRQAGGRVVALAAIYNRGGVTKEELTVPRFVHLVDRKLNRWPAHECPLCAKGIPINTKLGHGAEFVQRLRRTQRS